LYCFQIKNPPRHFKTSPEIIYLTMMRYAKVPFIQFQVEN
jgi:hypothetical protein